MTKIAQDISRVAPGLLLCLALTGIALLLERGEVALFGKAWIETLVLAILAGTVVRSLWEPGPRFSAGISFCAKTLLEIAVMLLGLSISFRAIAEAGLPLFLGILAVVAVSIPSSYLIGRMLGLQRRIALLVACGNSICGNSAIAAVAPVIGASGQDVASSIAFTAVLGVVVVVVLPLLAPALGLHETQYGMLAGLTVYAVPQVLAATYPVGLAATQMGTLVKLVRVLMLGPVMLALSFLTHSWKEDASTSSQAQKKLPPLGKLVPWFITGFLGMAALRSLGLVPDFLLQPAALTAKTFTVISMAGLGLGVDIRTVAKAGLPVTLATTLSLVFLGLISFALIKILG